MNGEGEVYWSPRAERFYQIGRRGALSNERGLRSLEYDPEAARFRDQRGRIVPDAVFGPLSVRYQRFVGRDEEGRPFIRTIISDKWISEAEARATDLARNEQLVCRITVRLPNGQVRTYYTSSYLGGRANLAQLEEQAKRNARGLLEREEDLEVDTPTIAGGTFRVDFIKRTVRVR